MVLPEQPKSLFEKGVEEWKPHSTRNAWDAAVPGCHKANFFAKNAKRKRMLSKLPESPAACTAKPVKRRLESKTASNTNPTKLPALAEATLAINSSTRPQRNTLRAFFTNDT